MTIPFLHAASTSDADASVIEKLVMPGPLIEAHASFEADCQNCHAPMSELPQRELCALCHIRIGSDIAGGRGLHGLDPNAGEHECSTCHTDHEGRDADIVTFDVGAFNHAYSDFPLVGAHRNPSCPDCHEPHEPYRDASNACVACHATDDAHEGQLTDACGDCHGQSDWLPANFDHGATGFQLTGLHFEVSCSGCHQGDAYMAVESTCVACHRGDDVHQGGNGARCEDCHTTAGWARVTFNHFRETGFALQAGHAGLTCQDCHSGAGYTGLQGDDCASCHLADDVHEGRNGNDCGSCHSVSQWASVNFDHAAATGFTLVGTHAGLSCTDCHAGSLTTALPDSCSGCHADDDTHLGQLGERCVDCHGQQTWTTQVLFEHDLTAFPLVGRHATVECKECHASPAFHDASSDCLACHREDDAHGDRLGTACASCHNPGAWLAWNFDHRARTGFPLIDGHASVACTDCHRQPMTGSDATSTVCGTCHRRDDPHQNRFGAECGRCHTTRSFSELENL